jgi:metallophosphoesterase (TIGR00282 family)
MRILFCGDVVGELGRRVLSKALKELKATYQVDFIIVNGENATHGKGLSEHHYQELVDAGADAITLGNHYHAKVQIDKYIDDASRLIRPLNLINYHYGKGSKEFTCKNVNIRVTNILGQAFLTETVSSPILALQDLLATTKPTIHIVDYHAESTSEKAIFGYVFAGKVSAVLCTHTHVQTNDARILEGKTGFISDVGMCGSSDGIIGFTKESVINKIVYGQNGIFELETSGPTMINAVLMDFDETSFACTSIKALNVAEGIL